MTYLVNDNCIKCKLTDCVDVCPVDCFYEGKNMLVIKPDECIDCGVCEPECPVDAIKADTDAGSEKWLEINISLFSIRRISQILKKEIFWGGYRVSNFFCHFRVAIFWAIYLKTTHLRFFLKFVKISQKAQLRIDILLTLLAF